MTANLLDDPSQLVVSSADAEIVRPGTAAHYKLGARADSTLRAYQSDLRHFIAWGGQLPTTGLVIEAYLAEHAMSLSPPTLRRRLAALSVWHKFHGYPNPVEEPGVKETLQGIHRERQWQPRPAPALTLEQFRSMLDCLGESLRDLRDHALLMTGMLGALRRSELAALTVADLEFVQEGMILNVRRSKTDPFGHGQKKGIHAGEPPYCPVWAVQRWLERAGIKDGKLFRRVNRLGRIAERGLSSSGINQIIKQCAKRAGLPNASQLSGHSLRAGLCTGAARLGEAGWKIRKISHHRSDRGLEPYIRDLELFRDNPTAALLKALARC